MPAVLRDHRLPLAAPTLALALYLTALATGWQAALDPLYVLIEISAVAACAWRAISVRADRAAWWCITAAMACYAAADLDWIVSYEHLAADAIPYPSITDALYLAFFPLVAVGIALLVRGVDGRMSRLQWLDGLIAALGAAAVGLTASHRLLEHLGDSDGVAVVVNLAYPVGDAIVLGLTAGLLGAFGRRAGRAWLVMSAAMLVFVVGDMTYLLQVADGTYVQHTLLDVTWPAALLLLAIAAWAPPGASRTRRRGPMAALVMPCLAGLAILALLVWDHYDRMPSATVWLSALCVLALLVRIALLSHGNRLMLARSERDARTDALTGLANRRALMEALEDVGPAVLALYDLDGFKTYNDRYGHPAGDALLQRLAGRLAAAAAPGRVFRIGGDEFCAIADPAQADAILRAARAALCERGEGFEIFASCGTVRLPDEAVDAAGALTLVDQRMYASKRAGRISAGAQTRDVLVQAVEERSPTLGGHVGDVAGLAVRVARWMGLGDDQVAHVRSAAELHDVGKLAVPDAILDKPGPLSPDEWKFMHRHTIVGERILLAAPALADVAPLVRASHERWDGGGYPDGLAGEQIPLGARIVALCDAWDAMVTDRPYRPAMAFADALAELDRCAGTQFDPAVARAFRAVLATETVTQVAA